MTKRIEDAVTAAVDSWDLDTLVEYAYTSMLEYYTGGSVSNDEIEQLLEDYSND